MKKILAILLTVCMVVCMIPGAAFADEKQELTSSNCTISVQDDYFLESELTNISVGGDFTTSRTITVKYKAADAQNEVTLTAPSGENSGDYTVKATRLSESRARVEITPTETSNYKNSVFRDFDIVKQFDDKYFISPKILSENPAESDLIPDQPYAGKKITPTPLYLYKKADGKDGDVTKIAETNYDVSVGEQIDQGSVVTVTFTGKGAYRGTVTKTFHIVSKALDASMITIPKVAVGSNVSSFGPIVKCGDVTFAKTTDYSVTIKKGNATYTETTFAAGQYTAVITFNENKNLTGTVEKQFTVDKAFSYRSVNITKKELIYDGTVQSIPVGNVVVKNSDSDTSSVGASSTTYTITYQKNGVPVSPRDVGTYDVVLTDANGGKYVKADAFVITQRNLTKTAVDGHYAYTSGLNTNYSYSGKMTDPTFNVYWYHKGTSTLLKKGTGYDYTTTYSYDYIRGKGSVTINFTGNFSGSITETFTIQRGNELSNYTVYIPNIADQAYTGTYVKPYVSVYYGGATAVTARTLLTEGVHYTLSYTSNINAGTATVTVTGKGAYSGTVTKNFNIKYNLSNATVTTTPATYAYDGRIKQPAVTVKIGYVTVPASDYIVTYSNNLKVGTATATVTAKTYGKSMGSNMAYFTITGKDGVITPEYAEYSKKTTKSKPFAIKIVSNTTDGTGYSYVSSDTSVATVSANGTVTPVGCGRTVITITTTGNRAYNPATATVTVTVKPTKGIISSLKSTAKGKLTVRYKKQSPNADYYQIRYGRAGDYTTKTIKNTSARTGKSTIKSLNSGKKYYVKVRGVKVLEDGTRLYGTWSVTKNAVTK